MITDHDLRACEIDISNTARARQWREDVTPPVDEADREIELLLRASTRINDWRRAVGLPLFPNPLRVEAWRAAIADRFWRAAWRRRHPHNPITTPPQAA